MDRKDAKIVDVFAYFLLFIQFGAFVVATVLVDFVHPHASKLDWGDCERCGRGFSSVSISTAMVDGSTVFLPLCYSHKNQKVSHTFPKQGLH